jgi:hypothetical protein
MIAAVLALRPNFDLWRRRVCPSADTIVPVMTSKVSTSIKASNLFIVDLPADLVSTLSIGKTYSSAKNGVIV